MWFGESCFLVADIVGFTRLAGLVSADATVDTLNMIIQAADKATFTFQVRTLVTKPWGRTSAQMYLLKWARSEVGRL